jgi:hypothetical protein
MLRTLVWACAIENLAIEVITPNLFEHSERGLAMVAAPETILLESTSAGMSGVDVSLERVRYLRSSRDVLGSFKRGLLGPQWQRPKLYDAIYPRPLWEVGSKPNALILKPATDRLDWPLQPATLTDYAVLT